MSHQQNIGYKFYYWIDIKIEWKKILGIDQLSHVFIKTHYTLLMFVNRIKRKLQYKNIYLFWRMKHKMTGIILKHLLIINYFSHSYYIEGKRKLQFFRKIKCRTMFDSSTLKNDVSKLKEVQTRIVSSFSLEEQ